MTRIQAPSSAPMQSTCHVQQPQNSSMSPSTQTAHSYAKQHFNNHQPQSQGKQRYVAAVIQQTKTDKPDTK